MTYISPVFELTIIGVVDTNVPNLERIVLRPTQSIDLGEFALGLGLKNHDGSLVPIRDQFFWLGGVTVAPPAWINVYTGNGQYVVGIANDGSPIHNYYWNRPSTVFTIPAIVPIVMRIGGFTAGAQLHNPAKRLADPRNR